MKISLFFSVPPKINTSSVVSGPGNCLDLTKSLENVHEIGIDMCVRAGERAKLVIKCKLLEGVPSPDIMWLRDGKEINRSLDSRLTLVLPTDASTSSKQSIEGNYTCVATNRAGITAASSYITLFGGKKYCVKCFPQNVLLCFSPQIFLMKLL